MQLRKMVWKDNPTVIRILSLPIVEARSMLLLTLYQIKVNLLTSLGLPTLQVPVNLKNFLYPVETDESMLETYMAVLDTETLK